MGLAMAPGAPGKDLLDKWKGGGVLGVFWREAMGFIFVFKVRELNRTPPVCKIPGAFPEAIRLGGRVLGEMSIPSSSSVSMSSESRRSLGMLCSMWGDTSPAFLFLP